MSAIGPELPPHLAAKRKRKQEEATEAAPTTASGAKRSSSPDGAEKRRKVLGPAMPPAPLDERPSEPPEPSRHVDESESDDGDGYGPAMPATGKEAETSQFDGAGNLDTGDLAAKDKLKRDDWMMMPPKQDDLAARMDPTKQRPRGFNTGKSAKSSNVQDDDSSAWYETPEQKQKRLADEMLGISKPTGIGPAKSSSTSKTSKDEAAAQKILEHTQKTRGPSLMDRHKQTTGPEADDDPSKRAFDRDKDMGAGMRIGHTQRKDMLSKASGFSSKFSGGSYL